MQPLLPSLVAAAALALTGGACVSAHNSASSRDSRGAHPPILLISIDGLRPEFYRAGSGWEAPTLQRLAAQGVSAQGAVPIFPSLTYPSHATIVTGVRSAQHGIFSNTIFSIQGGPTPLWYWGAEHLKSPTIWQRARQAGYKTAILTWPSTVGAEADWLIPEIFPAPPEVNGTTWEVMQRFMDPALAEELVAANDGAIPSGFAPRDEWVTRSAESILRQKHPDLTLIHLINVDYAEHESGKDSAETHQALRDADAQLERIMAAAQANAPGTTLILLGDHGFYDYDKVVRPNVLFAKRGWTGVNWKVFTHSEGGAAAIYTRAPSLGPAIIRLLKKNQGTAYRVIERAELDRLAAFPGAVCAINPATQTRKGPGYSVDLQDHGPFIEKLQKIRGNHGPLPSDPELETGLIAVGPGIPAGGHLGHVQLLDVAPTLARLMHVPLPEAQGRPIDLTAPKSP